MFSPQGSVCLVGLGVCGLLYVGVLQLALRTKPGVSPVLSAARETPPENIPEPRLPPTGLYALVLEGNPISSLMLCALFVQGVVEDIDREPKDLAEFAGNVSVVVNVASHCGFTEANYRGKHDV